MHLEILFLTNSICNFHLSSESSITQRNLVLLTRLIEILFVLTKLVDCTLFFVDVNIMCFINI